MLTFSPSHKELLPVVRDEPLDQHVHRLIVTNTAQEATFPLFITPSACVTILSEGKGRMAIPRPLGAGRELVRDTVALAPRETRDYLFLLDTQHDDFPEVGARDIGLSTEVLFEEQGIETSAGSVMLVIPEVLAQQPRFPGVVAADFGTTNTCVVASYWDFWQPQILEIEDEAQDRREEVPSLVAYRNVDDPLHPDVAVGREARLLWGQSSGEEVISSIKRYIGSRSRFLVGASGAHSPVYYDATEVAVHLLREIRRMAELKLGNRRIVELVCTYPTAFTRTQVDDLRNVFERVQEDVLESDEGVVPCRMIVDEATAAALFHLQARFGAIEQLQAEFGPSAFHVLCYDLGGGTTDVSLTRFSIDERPRKAAPVSVLAGAAGSDDRDVSVDAPATVERAQPFVRGRVIGQEGVPFFGGDNITLHLFRYLKARYAVILARSVREGLPSTLEVSEARIVTQASETVLRAEKQIQRWLEVGDSVPADPSIGFERHDGVDLGKRVWTAIDALVPTRFHDTYDFPGSDRMRRHEVFGDLWRAADNAKIQFGTERDDGTFPDVVETEPPPYLLDRFQLGPETLRLRIEDAAFRVHVEPHLRSGLCRVSTLLDEAGVSQVSMFVLAGNACRLPLVRELLLEHLAPYGANPDTTSFDPEVAKTAVAQGASLLAVHSNAPGGVRWTFEGRPDVLGEHIGTLATEVFLAKPEFQTWFERGRELPAHGHVEVPLNAPLIRVKAMRRPGARQRLFGSLELGEAKRIEPKAMPADLRSALDELRLTDPDAELSSPDEPTLAHVVVTRHRTLYMRRDGGWYRMDSVPPALSEHLDPFGGHQ